MKKKKKAVKKVKSAPTTRYGYMRMIDFYLELGENGAAGGNRVYPSVEDLKENHPCWHECGIVKVAVIYQKTIAKQDFIDLQTIALDKIDET